MKDKIEALIKSGKLTKVISKSDETILPAGQLAIARFLNSCGLPTVNEQLVGWRWLQESGEFKGTFPKRYASFAYKMFNIRLNSATLEELGNRAKASLIPGSEYDIKFTRDLDWENGTFGDGSSCFWGGRISARDIIKENNGFGVLFFNDGPVSRCWGGFTKNNQLVIFNGYSNKPSSYPLLNMAFALKTMFNVEYKEIQLRNMHNSPSQGVLYINGGRAFIIGQDLDKDLDKKENTLFLNWKEFEIIQCTKCSRRMRSNDDDVIMDAYNRSWCEGCAKESLFNCHHYNRPYLKSTAVTGSDGELYSRDAFHILFTTSFFSNKIVSKHDALGLRSGIVVSRDEYTPENFGSCTRCRMPDVPLRSISEKGCMFCSAPENKGKMNIHRIKSGRLIINSTSSSTQQTNWFNSFEEFVRSVTTEND